MDLKKGLKENYHWLISIVKAIVLGNKTGHKFSVVIKLCRIMFTLTIM